MTEGLITTHNAVFVYYPMMILSKIMATKTAPMKYTTASPPGTKYTYALFEVILLLTLVRLVCEGLC